MDPSGYGQTPPPPPSTPPSWAPPGAPGDPNQPFQPGQPGQPPAWGAPGDPNQPFQPGQPPAWGAPPPPVRSRSPLPRIIIGVVTIAILVAGGLLVRSFINGAPPDAGKVVFSTDKPVEGQTVGCTVDHQVTTIKAGESVYATYVFKGHQGADTVSLAVTKDGAAYLGPSDLPTTDTNGLDCFADTTDLSQYFAAGTYKFTLVSAGTTIAEGSLVVTP